MAKDQRDFTKGRMNKSVDERLLPAGEYIDAQNVRLGSTELSEVGAVENAKGNVQLTTLKYDGVALSGDAVCIGARDNSAKETMYWFVHDPNHQYGGVVDMIVSFNTQTQQLTYHVVTTVLLNFNPTYLVNGVNLIDNLLFFTDNYNPPRKINVTRAYPQPIAHVDQITELDISVIKPQPKESPTFVLTEASGQENYIEDAFICFAYRYKYLDGEYSALSQFTQPAFNPSPFELDVSSVLNIGMINTGNSVEVSFNTGSKNVVGIDIAFKNMDSNVIYIATKLDKSLLQYQNNSIESISFRNGDIYTILNSGESLRLYDNVPLLSKAQSVMGNRILYGNYVEGRDLIDSSGNQVNVSYNASFHSEQSYFNELIVDLPISSYNYYFAGNSPQTVANSMVHIDTTTIAPLTLKEGAMFSFKVTVASDGVGGSDYIVPNGLIALDSFTIQFVHVLDQDYTSVFDAFNSVAWKTQIGSVGGYESDPAQWVFGNTFTDIYNAAVPTPFSQAPQPFLQPYRSGRGDSTTSCYESDSPNTSPVYLGADTPDRITFIPNLIQYEEIGDPSKNKYYQYFSIVRAEASFFPEGISRSLHSNRDYQLGIIYQDAEGRQTTALTSLDSTIHIPARYSNATNSAKIEIPTTMHPPSWADRYKFVMKPSQGAYETIYSTAFYLDTNTSDLWVRLDGEQQGKLSIGQELIVKSDSNGPLENVIRTTVLDIKSQPADFIESNSNINGDPVFEPEGTYAKLRQRGWAANYSSSSYLTSGQLDDSTENTQGGLDSYPLLNYPLYSTTYDYTTNPPTPISYEPWEVLAGSVVNIKIKFKRRGRKGTLGCVDQKCVFNKQIVATQSYSNFKDFWDNEYVDVTLSDCSGNDNPQASFGEGVESECNIYNPVLYDLSSAQADWLEYPDQFPVVGGFPNGEYADCYGVTLTSGMAPKGYLYQFRTYSSGPNQGQFFLGLSKSEVGADIQPCGAFNVSPSIIECEISVRSSDILVFETIPTKTAGELYFENEQSFPITGGMHMSGMIDDDQDQTSSQSAIVNLTFFNCYQFSNGVESSKIKDSLVGSQLYLGNRVTSVSEQDYRQVRRESSITYGGIYNAQNNINRLNEFNLGLSNYKDCENSYGPIQVLHGRRTDLLTLQEDRISYVSLGKNMLVSADGQGILTSIPEILGVQVARSEEYGISENPESFAHYGSDIYFTDAKRASVIQLKGDSAAESLSVVSNNGMRSWFRDLFQTSFGYQKLGGYDPYMDEYILSPNTNLLPTEVQTYGCGGGQIVFTGLLSEYSFTIEAGRGYGNMTLDFDATHEFTVTATYNGVDYPVTGVGAQSISFDKDVPSIETITITITPNDPNGASTIALSVSCPVADIIKIIPVTITSASDAGSLIHNSYTYFDTTVSPVYQSGYQIDQVQFLTQNQMQYLSGNIVSRFGPVYAGPQGTGSIPIDNADVAMYATRMYNDTFDFDPLKHRLKYLRVAPTLSGGMPYENNAADINALLAASADAVVTGAPPAYEGLFPMPAGGDGDYLYLIWEYRNISEMRLCYAPTVGETCCECFSSPTCFPFLGSAISASSAAACALPNNTNTYYLGINPSTIILSNRRVYGVGGCGDVSSDRLNAGFINFDDNGTARWIEIDADNIIVNYGTC